MEETEPKIIADHKSGITPGVTASETSSSSPLPPHLYGKLIEEVDPFVFDDTFCVISKKYGHNYVYRFSATKSLFLFGPLNPLRKIPCKIISNQIFDFFIIVVIVANCVTLAMDVNSPLGEAIVRRKEEQVIEIFEYVFLAIYTMEVLLKIIAKGFVLNKYSYLRNFWNILDFTVVSSGYLMIAMSTNEFTKNSQDDFEFLRPLRVLRAIKTISILPGLRMMINALLSAARQLVEVMALTMFVIMIFALLALELYMGNLRQKCVLVKGGLIHQQMMFEEYSRPVTEKDAIGGTEAYANKKWYDWVIREDNWLKRADNYPKNEFYPCGNITQSRKCPTGYVCLENIGNNFDEGWTNFDNFFYSMLSTFQLITTDFWERLYELIMSSNHPFNVLFFVVVIFLGSFYLINLMLAVVAMSYEEEFQATQTPMTKHQKLAAHRTASTFSFDEPGKLNVIQMLTYRKRTPYERELLARAMRNSSSIRFEWNEDDEDGKKRPNLHNAIMTLLGRRMSGTTTSGGPKVGPADETIAPKEESSPEIPAATAPDPPAETGSAAKLPTTEPDEPETAESLVATPMNRYSRLSLRMRELLGPVVNHCAFDVVITTCIIVNTTLLASEHHNQPDWLTITLDRTNTMFLVVYLIEAILKLLALQQDYFRNWWNVFDLFVIIGSIADLVVDTMSMKLGVVRSMRLLRVFKLAQSWITMKILLDIIFSTFKAVGYLTLILLIVLYIFAVLGLQVVGNYYTIAAFDVPSPNDDDYPRWHFKHFGYSFMMVFRVLCGEWIEPLWDCFKATKALREEYKCFLIFLPTLIVGNFIVLNLFLALLLNSFDSEELNARRERELEASGKSNLKKVVGMMLPKSASSMGSNHSIVVASSQSVVSVASDQQQGDASNILKRKISRKPRGEARARFAKMAKRIVAMNRKKVAQKMIDKAVLKEKQSKSTRSRSMVGKAESLLHSTRSGSFVLAGQDSDSRVEVTERGDPKDCFPKKCYNCNCFCMNCCRRVSCYRATTIRRGALRVVTHPIFEWFILALIFASSITLCFEDIYLDERPWLQDALFYANTAFTTVFVMEMLLKWLALGIWNYYTSSWTILDFTVICISVISWWFEFDNRMSGTGRKSRKKQQLAALKALRTLRALRPLRAISRWQGMKSSGSVLPSGHEMAGLFLLVQIVVNALMFAIPSIVNVLLVCLLFWLIFAIMGVQFFKGKFYKCVDDEGEEVAYEDLHGHPYDDISDKSKLNSKIACCNSSEYTWINSRPNFDNVFQGYLTLFQVATFEGWMEAMQSSVDSTEVHLQPFRDASPSYYLFYVIFILVGAFFTLNLFIGVIIDNFNRLKKKYEGNLVEAFLTPSQQRYYTAMKKLGRKKPRKVIRRPTNDFFALFYDVSLSKRFEIAIFVMIFMNMVIMGFEHDNMRVIYKQIIAAANSYFTSVYALEAAVKIVGLRFSYFTVPWNMFDFLLVIASILDLFMGDNVRDFIPVPPPMLRIVRVFRIGRVLRLVQAAKGIRKLLFALVVSLPALFNIGALLALITFIYAVFGMALFGDIAKNTAIDEVFNFDTFFRSCLMLLRLMTAAGWNDVLTAMTQEHGIEGCGTYRKIKCGRVDQGEKDCANFALAVFYLVTYLMISYLIVINMYIAIILENFVEANREEEVGIIEDDLEMFYVRWSRYDPQATQFISFDQLSDFLATLDPPLGIAKPNIVAIVAFNLPIARGNKLHCLDILHSLIKHVLGHIDDSQEFRKLQEQMEHKFRKQFPTRKLLDIISSTRVWKIQHNAAVVIQRAWRAYRSRKLPSPLDSNKLGVSASLLRHTGSIGTHHRDHHGILNKMGNLMTLNGSRRQNSVKPNIE